MHCFYIDPPEGGFARLLPEEARHAEKVLRLKKGDELCAMDGAGGRWRAEMDEGGRGVEADPQPSLLLIHCSSSP